MTPQNFRKLLMLEAVSLSQVVSGAVFDDGEHQITLTVRPDGSVYFDCEDFDAEACDKQEALAKLTKWGARHVGNERMGESDVSQAVKVFRQLMQAGASSSDALMHAAKRYGLDWDTLCKAVGLAEPAEPGGTRSGLRVTDDGRITA